MNKILLLLLLCNCINTLKLNLLKTSIHKLIPNLKFHYIAVISDDKNIYTLDLSPINQKPITLLKLLFFQNVNAEIRLRHFYNNSLLGNLITEFHEINKLNEYESKKLTIDTLEKINDEKLYVFFKQNIKINTMMNLYNFNCQHFYRIIYNNFNIFNIFYNK